MTRKSKSSKHTWIDCDDGPPLTAAMARRGQVSEGGRIIRPPSGVLINDRRERSRMADAERAIKLRPDTDKRPK